MDKNKHKNDCPIEVGLAIIGKKWSLNIIRDLFLGKKRFKHFLESNEDLSTKMLSARLRELEEFKLIEKNIVSKSPIIVEYALTEKGRALNKIIYELVIFCLNECNCDMKEKTMHELKQTLQIH